MADVKWIKIVTDIFDDEKMLLIDGLPEHDGIIVIWFKLLCLAGKQNNSGVFMLNDKIPYTDEMLSTIFRRPLNTVRLALQTFEAFGMIEIIDNIITIPNWDKHQSLDKLEQAREKNRQRVAAHREKQRLIASAGENVCQYCGGKATGVDHIVATARGGKDTDDNKVPCCIECNRMKNDKPLVDFLNMHRERINDELIAKNSKLSRYVMLCNVTGHYIVTPCNDIEEDKEKDIEKDKEKEERKNIDYQQIADMYNEICISFPRLTVLSDKRKKAIKARLNTYTVEQFKTLFEKAESSDFLKGSNDRNWSATFDWLIKDSNFAKVIEGNYDNRTERGTRNERFESNGSSNGVTYGRTI